MKYKSARHRDAGQAKSEFFLYVPALDLLLAGDHLYGQLSLLSLLGR